MAAECKIRMSLSVTGLGQEKNVSAYALVSDTPTQVTGPMVVTVNTTQQLIDTLAIISGQLIGLYVRSLTSGVWISPFTTVAAVSACCYLPTDMWNFYTFQSVTSCVPSVVASLPGSKIEYAVVAIS